MINKLTYNWHQSGNMNDGLGENYDIVEVGRVFYENKLEVKEIISYPAMGEGDKWHYDIVFIDGSIKRVFNPNTVIYSKPNKK